MALTTIIISVTLIPHVSARGFLSFMSSRLLSLSSSQVCVYQSILFYFLWFYTVLTWGLNVQVLQEKKLHVREVVVSLYGYYDALE